MSILYGTTAPLGGGILNPAGCFTATVAIAGAEEGMTVTVTPEVYPGDGSGIFWHGFISAPDTVTVKVCSVEGGFLDETTYNVAVDTGTGGGGGGLPSVVAAVTLTGQTESISFNLLDGTQPTGDYTLNDLLTFTTVDNFVDVVYELSWAADSIGIALTSDLGAGLEVSIQGLSPFSIASTVSGSQSQIGLAWPQTLHADNGTPVTVSIILTPTAVLTASPTAGNEGSSYAPGDTGTITAGSNNAVYQVDTVGAGGAVTAVTIPTGQGGDSYTVSTGNPTATTTGSGTGLQLDITALVPSGVVYTYRATVIRNQ